MRHALHLAEPLAPEESENLNIAMFLYIFGNPAGNDFVRDRSRIATAGRLITRPLRLRTQLDDLGFQPLPLQGQAPLKFRSAARITTNRKGTTAPMQTVE